MNSCICYLPSRTVTRFLRTATRRFRAVTARRKLKVFNFITAKIVSSTYLFQVSAACVRYPYLEYSTNWKIKEEKKEKKKERKKKKKRRKKKRGGGGVRGVNKNNK